MNTGMNKDRKMDATSCSAFKDTTGDACMECEYVDCVLLHGHFV